MALTVSPDLARSTVPVLWSVTLSRLALSVLSLVLAVRAHVPDYSAFYASTYDTVITDSTTEPGPEWLSRGEVTLPGSVLGTVGLQLPPLWPAQAVVLHVTAV